ncbi:MAG: hypothetical protein R3B13_19610 [Polyangiaceae bacterium]
MHRFLAAATLAFGAILGCGRAAPIEAPPPAPALRGEPRAPLRIALESGDGLSCATSIRGRLACWTRGASGQLDPSAPVAVAEGVKAFRVVEQRVWFQKDDHWRTRRFETHTLDAPLPPSGVEALLLDGASCERADAGARCSFAEVGTRAPLRVDFPGAREARELRLFRLLGRPWLCARDASGRARCWDEHAKMTELGTGISALGGSSRVCAHFLDGRLACLRDDATPDALHWDEIARFAAVKEFGAGQGIGCALLPSGELHCWRWQQRMEDLVDAGVRYLGELRSNPQRIAKEVETVSVGEEHACMRLRGDRIECIGNVKRQHPAPQARRLPFTAATRVALGPSHACAIQGNLAWCWGNNRDGQLGRAAADEPRTEPEPVEGLPPVVELALGSHHTCARGASGDVHCFGRDDGRLGRAPKQSQWVRRVTDVAGATQLVAHDDATCALVTGRHVKCWGLVVAAKPALPPSEVPALRGADEISLGRQSLCARLGSKVVCVLRSDVGAKAARTVIPSKVKRLVGHCAITDDGGVSCLGWRPPSEQLEDSGPLALLVSLDLPRLRGAVELWASDYGVCARVEGGVRCTNRPHPLESPEDAVVSPWLQLTEHMGSASAAIASHQTCAVDSAGTLSCAGGFGPPKDDAQRDWHVPVALTFPQ